MSKYSYFVADRKVICVSRYAGKSVRGIAICADNDEFNINVGKDLAKTRCDYKIAIKRFNNIAKQNDMFEEELTKFQERARKLADAQWNAAEKVTKACEALRTLEATLE